jgi:hypothetical protein
MTWTCLLGGDDRELAMARVREIAAALEDVSHPDVDHPGVAGGSAGLALFHAYAAHAGLGGAERADELLGRSIDALAERPLGPSLYAGFSGIAWAAEHLGGPPAEGDDDPSAEIDAALLEHLELTPWTRDYDLISGLVGFGVYALERVENGRAAARPLLERVVGKLAETAVEVPGSPGVTWWTSPDLLIPSTREQVPQGYYNCGLAHGVPGNIAVLAGAAAHGVEAARPLLGRAVDWLLAQRREAADGSLFPYTVDIPPSTAPPRCRAAWCYGDPGIAVALLWAGQLVDEPGWVAAAREVARAAGRRRDAGAGVLDAGICHGAAGLALVFDRMWQATGDDELGDAATFWARRTLEMHRPGIGLGGYQSYTPGDAPGKGWNDEPGLLTGSAGIGLALLACATANEPRWDRFLLTSARPL